MNSTGKFLFQIPSWAKGVLVVFVLGATGFISWKVYKKVQERKNLEGARAESGAIDESLKTLPKATLSKAQLDGYANQLQTAMDGIGSNYDAIVKVMTFINTEADLLNVIKAYGIREINSGIYLVPNFKGTLSQAFTDELNNDQINAINTILAKKHIAYRF